jgi:transposase-like protein
MLYAWVSKFKKAVESSTNYLKVMQAEMANFKVELRCITEERDILKKGPPCTLQSGPGEVRI